MNRGQPSGHHQGAIGTTRNLTQQFITYRNDARRARPAGADTLQDRATASLLNSALGSSSTDVELANSGMSSAVLPAWVQKSERINTEMTEIKKRLTKLKEYHQKLRMVTFSADNDTASRAEALTAEIQQSFKRVDADVKSLSQSQGGQDDPEVRLQVQRQLATSLFQLSVMFRKEETKFLNQMEQQKGLEQGSTLGIIEDEASRGAETVDPGFTQAQLAMVDISTELIIERDQEIAKVVKAISELGQIMTDLATMIVDQGTMLDRIDHNIVQTAEKVEEGVKQLKQAETTQKRGRMFLCIIALIVLIVVMLIIVIVRHAL